MAEEQEVQASEETQQGQGDSSKDAKKFEENFKRFMLLFSNDKTIFKNKVPNDEVADVVAEMLEENREEAKKNFKTKGKALLLKKTEFDKFVRQKEAELAKAIIEKKKELSKEFESLFNEIENINELAKSMAASIREMGGGAQTPDANPGT